MNDPKMPEGESLDRLREAATDDVARDQMDEDKAEEIKKTLGEEG